MSVIYGSYYSIHQGKDVVIRSLCHSVPPIHWGGKSARNGNVPMPTAPCGGGGCRAPRDGGWGISPKPLAKGETRVTKKRGDAPFFIYRLYGVLPLRSFLHPRLWQPLMQILLFQPWLWRLFLSPFLLCPPCQQLFQ